MKLPRQIDYTNVPGVKTSAKYLVAALLRKLYIKPGRLVKAKAADLYFKIYRLPVDKPIHNAEGINGVYLVASYTDGDKGYLRGLIDSAQAFEKVILFHDKASDHRFNYNESARFQLLTNAAKREGAKWVLIGSPKTRFSSEFKNQIAPLVKKYQDKPTILALKERYLWEDFDHFVFIGQDGHDVIVEKFFSVTDNMIFDNKAIHASQHPINYPKSITTSASRYYLGRFNLAAIKAKAKFYGKIDGIDYSFMANTSTPERHNETVLGIGDFEVNKLSGK